MDISYREDALAYQRLLTAWIAQKARTRTSSGGAPFALAKLNTWIRAYDAGMGTFVDWLDAVESAAAACGDCYATEPTTRAELVALVAHYRLIERLANGDLVDDETMDNVIDQTVQEYGK